ncbi:TonB-dependent receptor family protein [Marinobacter sp.]|uniref:TonB-dependent receptor family protein n=1 Tax=Marinobacter sp. TaxID=50741 RepID=UPI00384EEEB5
MAELRMKNGVSFALLFLALSPAAAHADEPLPVMLEGISVIGTQGGDQATAPGSAFRVTEETLEQDEYDNINRVLNDVPGVYIRGEDGYGLRPNIGLRGTTTERSQKITLMMDGVLMAPAPYSAPAAYFFPQVSRMTGVEVVKGPAAIAHGPATVGGAVNLISRSIPGGEEGGLDLAGGTDDYRKVHGYYGRSGDRAGFLVEAIHTRTDGFKKLDDGGDTGYDKTDVMLKGRLNSDPAATRYHQLDLTLNYATETSNETYLGLTDDDFSETPFRRYAASQNALFEWDYYQAHLQHRFEPSSDLALVTEGYYQIFERDWNKLNRFNTSRTLGEILANPDSGLNADFMAVLRGEKDTQTAQEVLMIGNNGREYFSRGVQTRLEWNAALGTTDHRVITGLRFHQDEVERDHTEQGFLMRSGELRPEGSGVKTTLLQREGADALAFFIKDEIRHGKLRLIPGVRLEYVEYESENRKTGERSENDNSIWLPGLGVHYQLTESFGLLAGAHRGFVPTGPGMDDDIEPEESVSYEAGMRYITRATQVELIGFFNDYSNLKGVCTFSSGCIEATGEAFNAGEVDVYGLEAVLRHEWTLENGWRVPLGVTYTYTESEFQTSFESDFPLWGDVSEGDELPYMPRHKGSATLGLTGWQWGVNVRASYVGSQKEQAGDSGPLAGAEVDDHTVVDLNGHYEFLPEHLIYGRVENLLDNDYLLSRRPLGARPGIDRTLVLGYKFGF